MTNSLATCDMTVVHMLLAVVSGLDDEYLSQLGKNFISSLGNVT